MNKLFPCFLLCFFATSGSLFAVEFVTISYYDPAGSAGNHYRVYDFTTPTFVGNGGLYRRLLPDGSTSFYVSSQPYFSPSLFVLQTFKFTLIDENYAKVEAFGPFTGVGYIGRSAGQSTTSFTYNGVAWQSMALPPAPLVELFSLRHFYFSVYFGEGGSGVIFQGGSGLGSGGGGIPGPLTVDPATPDPSTIVDSPMAQGQTNSYWADWKVSLKPLDTSTVLKLGNEPSEGANWQFISSYDGSWYRGSGAKPAIDAVMIGFATLQAFLMGWHEFRKT